MIINIEKVIATIALTLFAGIIAVVIVALAGSNPSHTVSETCHVASGHTVCQ